jgi:hypothetical protein
VDSGRAQGPPPFDADLAVLMWSPRLSVRAAAGAGLLFAAAALTRTIAMSMIKRPDTRSRGPASELRKLRGRYWDRTSDLFGVNSATRF